METREEKLVKLAAAGDREAFTELVRQNEEILARTALALLRDPEDGADAVQEAVLAAWLGLPKLKQPRYFRTWLLRILIRKCGAARKEREKHRHGELEETAAVEKEDRDEALDARAAFDRLSPEDRLVLGLFYGDGLSIKELSAALRVTQAAAKARLYRGRERFRKLYEQGGKNR